VAEAGGSGGRCEGGTHRGRERVGLDRPPAAVLVDGAGAAQVEAGVCRAKRATCSTWQSIHDSLVRRIGVQNAFYHPPRSLPSMTVIWRASWGGSRA
jgi:hypothetical protein